MKPAERTLSTACRTLGFNEPPWYKACWKCRRRANLPYRTIGRLILNNIGLCPLCYEELRR